MMKLRKNKYFFYFLSLFIIFFTYSILSNVYFWVDTTSFPTWIKKMFHPIFLPPIQEIFSFLSESVMDGTLQTHILSSFLRVSTGLVIGAGLGIFIGFLMAWFKKVDYTVDPVYGFFRPIPPISFVTLFILWFGIGDFSIVLLIIYGTFVVTLIPTYHAIKEIPDIYLKAAKVLGTNTKMLLRRVVFPAASPRILTGLRFAVMGSWTTMVAAELIGCTSGIGYIISKGQAMFETNAVIAGILLLVVCALIFDIFVKSMISRSTRWMKRVR